jgi:hypothetical protein
LTLTTGESLKALGNNIDALDEGGATAGPTDVDIHELDMP